ncbi:MAG: hypothetical protein JO061_08505, partial [Acidobacteriaceae bacterium]|nr:hypothetical protein [Acidobacteriaceae bacterium]
MPDCEREVRAAIARMNLEPAREQSIVEELAEHLGQKYAGMLTEGVPAEEALRLTL